MIATVIREGLEAKGRGARSGLARHTGTTPTTVARWASGPHHPERDRWPAIEAYLELDAGAISAAAQLEALQTLRKIFDLSYDMTLIEMTQANAGPSEILKQVQGELKALKVLLEHDLDL